MAEKAKEVNTEIVVVNADRISAMTGFNNDKIAIIKSTVAKGTNDNELAYFLTVAQSVGLNPMVKEIWCYKDWSGNLLVFAGRDGYLKIGQKDSRWNGMSSAYVCANDEFELDIPQGKVKHKPNFKDRGAVIGGYAIIKPKGCDLPTVEWADIKIYDKSQAVWKSHKESMIQKVAEIHALKKAFGIEGLNTEYDFDIQYNTAMPLDTASPENDMKVIQKKIIDGLDAYDGDDKEAIKKMCIEKNASGEFDMKFATETAKTIGVTL
jgi:hypothetical protein